MNTKMSRLIMACVAITLLAANLALANDNRSAVGNRDYSSQELPQSQDAIPEAPVPEADGNVGEASVSDLEPPTKSHANIRVASSEAAGVVDRISSADVPVSNTSLVKSVIDDQSADCTADCDLGGCVENDCGINFACRTNQRYWVRADYLLWWTQGS